LVVITPALFFGKNKKGRISIAPLFIPACLLPACFIKLDTNPEIDHVKAWLQSKVSVCLFSLLNFFGLMFLFGGFGCGFFTFFTLVLAFAHDGSLLLMDASTAL
jgi:hypothetical protein